MMVHTCNSSTREAEVGGSGFKASLDHMASSGPVWNTWDAVSNKENKTLKLIKTVCAFI